MRARRGRTGGEERSEGAEGEDQRRGVRAWRGVGLGEREDRDEKGIMDVLTDLTHLSVLSNGKKRTECGWNGLESKEVQNGGICVRPSFLMACV